MFSVVNFLFERNRKVFTPHSLCGCRIHGGACAVLAWAAMCGVCGSLHVCCSLRLDGRFSVSARGLPF